MHSFRNVSWWYQEPWHRRIRLNFSLTTLNDLQYRFPVELFGPVRNLPSFNINLPLPTLTVEEVTKTLKCIDSSKGPAPDKLPPELIQRCAEAFGPPVCRIFNMSLSEVVFPDAWKLSAVTPVYKTSNFHDVRNCRPISILSCLAKTLELLVHDRMYSAAKPIISQNQHFFEE